MGLILLIYKQSPWTTYWVKNKHFPGLFYIFNDFVRWNDLEKKCI